MRIAYVGNFTQPHCTEVHLSKTLEDLGHEVIRIQEADGVRDPFWITPALDADLFLYTRTWGKMVTLGDLETFKKHGIPTVSYHLDLYVGLSRKYLHEGKSLDEILQTDPFWRTDYVFTPDGDPKSAEVFQRNGVNHHYMKAAVFKPECILASVIPEIDVLFVGGGDCVGSPHGYGHKEEWPYRDQLITWLYDTYGDRFKKFGHPQVTVRNDELNRLYQRSKVVVGDSVCLDFDHENYWSDRVYETLGRGGFLIHPYIKGMEEEFQSGKHLVFYKFGDFDDLKSKIDYYLTHAEEREAIRRAGHEFVKKHATYHNRLELMLGTVFGDTAPITATGDVMPLRSCPRCGCTDNDCSRCIAKTGQRCYWLPNGLCSACGLPSADIYMGDKPFKINLGAGSEPSDGWVNVDWIKGEGIQVQHNLLLFPWPFEDECADEIKAIDVLEHMPNYTPDNQATALAFVEECWRLLQDGGKLVIQVPHWNSPNMWIDPTHVRGFDVKSMDYFDPDTDFGKWYGYYTRGKFKVTAELSHMGNGALGNVTFTMVKRGR